MKKYLYVFCVSCISLLASCVSKKELTYFQDLPTQVSDAITVSSQEIVEPMVRIGDKLYISITALEPEAAESFNATRSYLVDIEGNIVYPILGKLHVDGLKKSELVALLQNRLGALLKDPLVTISFLNYRITILGEVIRPGVYTTDNERITLLEALGLAGDITPRGKRDNVLIVRENNGKIQILKVDLKSIDTLSSSCYYLQQNDIVYVAPAHGRRIY